MVIFFPLRAVQSLYRIVLVFISIGKHLLDNYSIILALVFSHII